MTFPYGYIRIKRLKFEIYELHYFVAFSALGIIFSACAFATYSRLRLGQREATRSLFFRFLVFLSFFFFLSIFLDLSFFFSCLLWNSWLHNSILQALKWIQLDNRCTHCQPTTRGRCRLRNINLVGHSLL